MDKSLNLVSSIDGADQIQKKPEFWATLQLSRLLRSL